MLLPDRNVTLARRGITLLFVISMIVLFLLLGTTFVVVSNQFYRDSRGRQQRNRFLVDGKPLVEETFFELLRGADLDDTQSPFRGHSLLEDMYGYGFSATLAAANADTSGHFFVVTLNNDARSVATRQPMTPSPVPGSMSGLLLSVVSGPANGLTARVVDHQVSGTAGSYVHRLVLMPIWLDNGFTVTDAPVVVGARVVINGRPFSGTGAGHFTSQPQTAPALSGSALLPRLIGESRAAIFGTTGTPGYYSIGTSAAVVANSRGPNEAYDTFDFQNMFLAGLRADGRVIEPSFHRQTLVDQVALPARTDFRAFRQGGPANDGVLVDNNNDGVPEGIWIDVNAPTQTSPEGQTYKPLVSVTIVDMDSKINVNAHGNRSQLIPPGNFAVGSLPTLSGVLSKGQGMGPAEIRMGLALGLGTAESLMLGTGAIPGRYGLDGKPGLPDVRDRWSAYKLYGYPENPFVGFQPGTVGAHFGSAMDIFGRFGYAYPSITDVSDGVTPIGLPMGTIATSGLPNEIIDSPYEMSFSDHPFFGPVNSQVDAPFTAKELEAVLRPLDPDARQLPQRLLNLGGGALAGTANQLVTTSSVEVPTLPDNLISRLYQILLTSNPGTGEVGIPDTTANREQVIRQTIIDLVPNEFRRGLPMNVNRAFGDGVDNNNNGAVDEIGEADLLGHPDGATHVFDHDNDSATAADANTVLARANFARQLFVLTLLVTERVDRNGDGVVDDADWYDVNRDSAVDWEDRIVYRRHLAQWAVNVVDFRDPDSIMTPVEFDLNPFNGWDVDNRITSTESITEGGFEMREVVWGAERPELLISETLALHDVRTQNLSTESPDPGDMAGTKPADDLDYDSFLVPNPSAFFELYNPWVMNDANQVRPGELYNRPGLAGVELQRKSLDGASPVWRLVVTQIDDPNTPDNETLYDPDTPSNNPGGIAQRFDRRIYFARPTQDSGPEVYYPEDTLVMEPIPPGRYAVVGSAGTKVGDLYNTYLGRRTGADALDPARLANETRRISLNADASELEIVSRSSIGASWQVSTRAIPVLPIGLNDGGWARNLGVSDPLFGYEGLTDPAAGYPIAKQSIPDGENFAESTTTGALQSYTFDQPVDKLIDPVHYSEYLQNSGLKPGYRVVHLQRLANPIRRFDPVTNPYRTIDSSAIDLFVFNGAETQPDPDDVPTELRFGTSERQAEQNNAAAEIAADRHRILFRNDRAGYQSAMARSINDFTGTDEHIFSRNLVESLGRLNQSYRDAGSTDQRPFSWLQWNNRPFVSQLELTQVPFLSSFELTSRFSNADSSRNVYLPDGDPILETSAINLSGHYAHLLNFYADHVERTTDHGPQLHRMFPFLEVPSRYVGTEAWVNPGSFANNAHGLSFGLAPPFDSISSYRYPGKININTITDQRVWNALMGDYASAVPFAQWEASRQGHSPITSVGNPYRPAHAANVVPAVPSGPGLVRQPVDVGLFRQVFGAGGASTDTPLLDFSPTASPLPAGTDGDRAAYFRYDMRQRLGNLVTGRSSVFGIWITVGYFETLPDGTLIPGPGLQGRELGAETGELKRSRGFFMVDRSIPVAFEPGQNHNIDRAVLIKSIIE